MMIRISNIFRIVLSFLLASLGFSCSRWFVAEYGAPHATYKAKGIVVSEEDNSPIEGIKANFLYYYGSIDYEDEDENYYRYPITTTYTSSSGAFFLKARYMEGSSKLIVELLDVDGETNGSFERKIIVADYSNVKLTGGSGWYEGEASINLGTIKMKPVE